MRYSLDMPGIYTIRVLGGVDESWCARLGGLTLMHAATEDEKPKKVTVLIGRLEDQAALFGVLDTLLQNGYPILNVQYLGPIAEDASI
jgi:hypothetical protein